jgi:hypothetical protein
MPTAIQKNVAQAAFPAMLWARDMTIGQGEVAGLLMRQIVDARAHVSILNESSFALGYQPFKPKRSFQTKVHYRFTGRMPALAIDLED